MPIEDGKGVTYQGRIKHYAPDSSSIILSKFDHVPKLPGNTFAPADVGNVAYWVKNIEKYKRDTPSDEAKSTLLRHVVKIRNVLKLIFHRLDWHLHEPTSAELDEIAETCWAASKGSAGIGWQEYFRNKGALFKRYGVRNLLEMAINGVFNGTITYDKSCGKDELRALITNKVKDPRGFIPKQVHVYIGSAVVFTQTHVGLIESHVTMIGFNPFSLGMHRLYVELDSRRAAMSLPDNWISADIEGNDKGQQAYVRDIYHGNFTVAPSISVLHADLVRTMGAGFIAAQNGDVFLRECGFDTGGHQTLNMNSVHAVILFVWILIEKGVSLYNIAEWPFKVMGDDLLACWPESFGNFYVFANDLVTPATTLCYTNENAVVNGEPLLWSPLRDAQILSYGWRNVNDKMMPYPWRANKLLSRLDYETPHENPMEVAFIIFVMLYFHDDARKIVADHITKRWGPIAHQKAILKAMAMHYGFQCGGVPCGVPVGADGSLSIYNSNHLRNHCAVFAAYEEAQRNIQFADQAGYLTWIPDVAHAFTPGVRAAEHVATDEYLECRRLLKFATRGVAKSRKSCIKQLRYRHRRKPLGGCGDFGFDDGLGAFIRRHGVWTLILWLCYLQGCLTLLSGGWMDYKSDMSAKTPTNATGAAATITKKQTKKKQAPKAMARAQKKPTRSPAPKVVRVPQYVPQMPKQDAAELAKQMKLLKATIQPIDFGGLAHLPTQDATSFAHFHQRTTEVFPPNADGSFKAVITNEPDARAIVKLDAPPANLQTLVPADQFVPGIRSKGVKPYRINFDNLRHWKKFKADFWEHAHDPMYRAHMAACKRIEKTRFVNSNGHRIRLPSMALTSTIRTYSLARAPDITTNTSTNSWWYNNGSCATNGLVSGDGYHTTNGDLLFSSPEGMVTFVGWVGGGRSGFVKPLAVPAPVSKNVAPFILNYNEGESIYSGYDGQCVATSPLSLQLVAAAAGLSTTGAVIAPGDVVANALPTPGNTIGGSFAWVPTKTPRPGIAIQLFLQVSVVSGVNNCLGNWHVSLSCADDLPNPGPASGWYGIPTIDAETINAETQSLRVIGSEAEISCFQAPIAAKGQITQCTLPADFWETHTLNDVTTSTLVNIPDHRNAAFVEGGRSFLAPFQGQAECFNENDVSQADDVVMSQPCLAFVCEGMDPTGGNLRLQTGVHWEGPSVSQLFVNKPFPPDIIAQQRIDAAAAVIPHHNGNPLGLVAIGACLLAYKAASLAVPAFEDMSRWLARFKSIYDEEYALQSSKLARRG